MAKSCFIVKLELNNYKNKRVKSNLEVKTAKDMNNELIPVSKYEDTDQLVSFFAPKIRQEMIEENKEVLKTIDEKYKKVDLNSEDKQLLECEYEKTPGNFLVSACRFRVLFFGDGPSCNDVYVVGFIG